ncbi:MAG: 2-oxoglutarate ferredoxin oxidoreductase subunit gamma [Candidatus Cloacimonadota bacterium]|nr:MAG: 2-oxoglutarate ferredoxin oxidoreductase subunit gamma [Candidatus Cloacimonadota bacterium]PIE78612.1 MAG: 2-oxoglutarate ferredoxin oxidoreductase subunit gamma [Candidatus Delongbacteria bacterium]
MKHYEARFAGVGGQGVILAGKILAYSYVVFEGGKAIQTPTYTAQVRGGATKVDVVFDKDRIEYPKTEHLDFFLSLHQKSFDIYFKEMKKDAIIIVDPNLTPNVPKNITQKLIKVELIEIAKEEFGKTLFAAVIAAGIFTKLSGLISEANVIKAVLDNAPKGTEEINLKAVKMGFELAKKYM